jgi:hypothetical protein
MVYPGEKIMGSFALDVRAFVEKTKQNNETVMRQVTLKLFSAIIKASPVDTGRFRMNWQASGPIPSITTTDRVDRTGEVAITQMSDYVLKSPEWGEFTLTNNLPYATVIEFGGYPGEGPNTTGGFSKQAPQGVVRVNVLRFQQLIDEEAAKVR